MNKLFKLGSCLCLSFLHGIRAFRLRFVVLDARLWLSSSDRQSKNGIFLIPSCEDLFCSFIDLSFICFVVQDPGTARMFDSCR